MAGARRRSRGPGHREHGRGQELPDRARRRRAQPRQGGDDASSRAAPATPSSRFTAWHNQVWTPVIAAVNGSCAGGGLHFVADADIVIAASDATFFDTHVSLGQAMSYEGVGLSHKMAVRADHAHGAGRALRAHARGRARCQLGMVSQIVDPPERLREEAQVLAEKIARNSPAAMRATKRALWGALEHGLTDACRAGAPGARRDVGPPRPGGRAARVRREAGGPLVCDWRRGDVTLSTYDTLEARATRPGRVVDQQPARAAQRDEQPHARRVRRRVARARRRPRRSR